MLFRHTNRRGFCLALAALAGGQALAFSAHAADGPETRIALNGYDPVAYFTDGKATRGDPQFQYAWDGAVYHFASARHLALFKVDPDRYLPQYGSLCTASLAGDRKFPGDPKSWLVHDGRLYLFGSASAQAAMTRNPAEMKARADAIWAKMSGPSAPRR